MTGCKPIYRIRRELPDPRSVRGLLCLTPWDHVPKRIFWHEGAVAAILCGRSSGSSIQAVLIVKPQD